MNGCALYEAWDSLVTVWLNPLRDTQMDVTLGNFARLEFCHGLRYVRTHRTRER